MNPEDVPTIETILTDYGVNDMLDSGKFADLLAELQNRELTMVTDIGPKFIYAKGLDNIINQY